MTPNIYDLTTSSRIAWAYLQRNPDYRYELRHYPATKNSNLKSELFPCSHQTQSDLYARKWYLLTFNDPKTHSLPFWNPDLCYIALYGEVINTESETGALPFLHLLRKANLDIKGLLLLDGRLCLNISSSSTTTQLMFPPGTTLNEHSEVKLILTFDMGLPIQNERAKTLWDVINGKAKKMPVLN